MTVCFNPACLKPQNPDDAVYCQNCGSRLQLGNRYKAVRLIGQGGFGRTFLAVAPIWDRAKEETKKGTARANLCVIKQLLPQSGFASRDADRLFEQEIRQLALLGKHPQIPQLLAHFEDETARYLIQEFIEGQNLDAVLQQGTFSEVQIRKLLADLLPVLRFIHAHQVVHRDIKPANIILPDQGDRYVLVDFGAAKSIVKAAQTGTTIGSAGYVAPEQAMGKATFASDLYSLGVTCIHLLTGIHPFDLYSVGEDRWVWRQYLTQPISIELRRVLDTLLQRATNQRYHSATAVLQDLRLEAAAVAQKLPIAVGQIASSTSPASPAASTRPAFPWRCLQTLIGHQGEVTAIALSPNGELIASGSTDKTIRLWSLETGELLYTWMGRSFRYPNGHHDRITALTFSPNSEILISSSADGTIKQWDLSSGELFSSLPGHGWGVSAMALSPYEPLLVSGSEDGLIQLWDLETEELITNLVQLNQSITALKIDSTGNTLWSSGGKPICQWDLGSDRLLTTLKGHAEGVDTIALSADNCTLISSGGDKLLKLWNLNNGQQQKLIAAHRDRVHDLAIHPTEPYFASASEDSTIKLWDLWTGERLATLRHTWSVNTIEFSADGLLVSGSADEMIKIWCQDN